MSSDQPATAACAFGDPTCPCQDGDVCHYVDDPKSETLAMTPPATAALPDTRDDGCPRHGEVTHHQPGCPNIPSLDGLTTTAASVECVCGAPIKRVTLPPDIARACGRAAFWNHIGGDIYCYEDDRQAMAEPLEAPDGK